MAAAHRSMPAFPRRHQPRHATAPNYGKQWLAARRRNGADKSRPLGLIGQVITSATGTQYQIINPGGTLRRLPPAKS